MPSLLIRDVDDALHAQLKARARLNHRSMEAEARETLWQTIARDACATPENLMQIATRIFGPENGVDLKLPPRHADVERPAPDFASPDFDP